MQSYNLIEAKAEQIKGGLLMWVLNIIELMVFGYISAKLVHSTSRWGLTLYTADIERNRIFYFIAALRPFFSSSKFIVGKNSTLAPI
jgi:hypothetical protein